MERQNLAEINSEISSLNANEWLIGFTENSLEPIVQNDHTFTKMSDGDSMYYDGGVFSPLRQGPVGNLSFSLDPIMQSSPKNPGRGKHSGEIDISFTESLHKEEEIPEMDRQQVLWLASRMSKLESQFLTQQEVLKKTENKLRDSQREVSEMRERANQYEKLNDDLLNRLHTIERGGNNHSPIDGGIPHSKKTSPNSTRDPILKVIEEHENLYRPPHKWRQQHDRHQSENQGRGTSRPFWPSQRNGNKNQSSPNNRQVKLITKN